MQSGSIERFCCLGGVTVVTWIQNSLHAKGLLHVASGARIKRRIHFFLRLSLSTHLHHFFKGHLVAILDRIPHFLLLLLLL